MFVNINLVVVVVVIIIIIIIIKIRQLKEMSEVCSKASVQENITHAMLSSWVRSVLKNLIV